MHVTAYNVFLLGICIIKSDSNITILVIVYDCCLYSAHMRALIHIYTQIYIGILYITTVNYIWNIMERRVAKLRNFLSNNRKRISTIGYGYWLFQFKR